ncbi:type II toxin-antitoxin system HicB family antitoxin [Methylosinus sp. Sm6]|uniref:type II toxin-antitoxin system HicB family antitoxin n=1 Tax=Methylosinus sp. Sm6 TaxID=2866948 RepID=UPI001C99E07D|nr:type II toxin-antitoxin system HicB family antitoxin [Methylosinus sp. Sm6]MBY6240648.1 type II toxin-antitoxin system HicB family antitoxin [Methylosinus sp. Sm6]
MSYAIALIHEEGGGFGISFPDFPGCVSTGRTIDEAIAKGAQALALHVAGMAEDGEPLPQLRGVSQLRADPELADWFADATVAAIEVELPRRAVRVNISIDEGLLERIDRAASAVGQSRSSFLAEAAKRHIAGA